MIKKVIRKIANSVLKVPRLPFPTEMEFEPIQLCNAKCFVCPYTRLQEDKDYRGKKMSREQIDFVLSDFGNLLKKYNYTGPTLVNPFRYSDPLVCRDLDVTFENAKKFGFKVRITTNGVSFNEKYCKILNDNFECLAKPISISIIGSNSEKVKKYMSVNFDVTLERLKKVARDFPNIASLIVVNLSEVDEDENENKEFEILEESFKKIGLKTSRRKKWINNRITGDWKITADTDSFSKENFVIGCNLFKNKLLRRIEIMVDGSVVLCDDDAEGKLKFGNVFEKGIEKIWNGQLLDYHKKIYEKKYSKEKNSLVCNSCSRATVTSRKDGFVDTFQQMGKFQLSKQIFKSNVEWF